MKSHRRLSDERAEHALRFVGQLTHTKGRWSGAPFHVLPWQESIIRQAYGTLRPDGLRQYRTVYLEIPKKNGKTELGATIGLKQLCADGENEPEVYSAAADREQAAIVYGKAAMMTRRSRALSRRLKVIDSTKRLVNYGNGGFWKVLSRESRTKHGLNPSAVIFDELHALANRSLYDVLTSETDIAREQQLVWIMTTAGDDNMETVGFEVHEYARQVRDGIVDDPSFLPVIYACEEDQGDDWKDPEVWQRVNPSCGHIFGLDRIQSKFDHVVRNPAYANEFKRFRLNIWVSDISRWLSMHEWDQCVHEFDPTELEGRDCFGALDLSSRIDMTAFALCFPPKEKGGLYRQSVEFFMPEEGLHEREKNDKVPYRLWVQAGLLTLTPGHRVDYDFVIDRVVAASKKHRVVEVAYDPWNAESVAQTLSDDHGLNMVEHRQGYKSMSEPCKEFLGLVKDQQIAHNGNRILRWNVDNLRVRIDESENVRPVKDRAARNRKRIDGVVAAIMATGRAVASKDTGASIYDERGLLYI